jgi:hypothetical protein
MTTEKENFIEAIENNEYGEYQLDDTHTLITDMDSKPYVHVTNENYQGHEHIIELMENEALDILTWNNSEIYSQQNSTFMDLFGIRYTY